jgi:catechol 2,3-dioxygenase
MSILRLSHVELRTPDLELSTAYYTEVIGLIETARESDRVFFKAWDERQHHSLVLTFAPTHGLNHLGFKVTDASDLDVYAARLADAGVDVVRTAAGEWGPGHGESLRFELPSGHSIELVHGMEQVGNSLPLTNPPPRPMDLVGIAPPRIDHAFLTAEDVGATTDFLVDVLGFRVTEQVVGDDGFRMATWLEVSHASHDIALLTGPNGGLHHVAWFVEDWGAIRDAADLCVYHGVELDTNPTRHGATRGHCLYFFDPVGNRNEVFTGGYWVDPGSEPTVWTEAEMGRALFWYDGVVRPRFLTVHS